MTSQLPAYDQTALKDLENLHSYAAALSLKVHEFRRMYYYNLGINDY